MHSPSNLLRHCNSIIIKTCSSGTLFLTRYNDMPALILLRFTINYSIKSHAKDVLQCGSINTDPAQTIEEDTLSISHTIQNEIFIKLHEEMPPIYIPSSRNQLYRHIPILDNRPSSPLLSFSIPSIRSPRFYSTSHNHCPFMSY